MIESDKSKGKFTKTRFLFFIIFTTKSMKSIVTPYLYLNKKFSMFKHLSIYFFTSQQIKTEDL